MDPQHRIFMEVAYEALESSGYAPSKYKGTVGVFAGASENNYFINHIFGNHEVSQVFGA